MDSDRDLPEDGTLPSMGNSTHNYSMNNIMLVKIPNELRKPGELMFAFATIDRTIPGFKWPADEYIDSLIPGLQKVEITKEPGDSNDESEKEEVEEENEKPLVTKPVFRQNSYQRPNQMRSLNRSSSKSFRAQTLVHRRKNWNDRSEPYRERKRPGDTTGIDPWVHKPWEEPSFLAVGNKLPIEGPVNQFPRQVDPGYFAPPLQNIPVPRHKKTKKGLLGDAPANGKFENINPESNFAPDGGYALNRPPNTDSYNNFGPDGYGFVRGDDRPLNPSYENLNRPPPNAEVYDGNFGPKSGYNFARGDDRPVNTEVYDNNFRPDGEFNFARREDRQPNVKFESLNHSANVEVYDNNFSPDGGYDFSRDDRQINSNLYSNFDPRDDLTSCASNFKGSTFKKRPQRAINVSCNSRGSRGKRRKKYWNNENSSFRTTESTTGISNIVPNCQPLEQRRPWGRGTRNSSRLYRNRQRSRARQKF